MEKLKNLTRAIGVFSLSLVMLIAQMATVSSAMAQSNNLLAPFTSGNLVVYRVGSGADALSNTGNAVFLDEFTPTGTLVQSIPLPTTASGANRQLIANGTSSAEGFITRSLDGRYLILTGYARNLGGTGAVSSTTSTDVPRVIGRVDANGNVDTSTAITDAFSAANIRSAVSTNGTDIWAAGSTGGVRYLTFGGSTTVQVNTGANAVTNLRQINIFNNQLYFSTGSGTNPRVVAVGTGTPTTTGQDSTPLANVPGSGSPYGFFFADLSTSVAGVDTLYVADDTTTAGGIGGIQKYSLVGGVWTATGIAGTAADSYRGLTGVVNGTTVTLYATRKGGTGSTGGGELVSLVDSTGYNGTLAGEPTLLATAAANTAFRGVALAPTGGSVVPTSRTQFDFDGDGKADVSVFRPSDSGWYLLRSTAGFFATFFGTATDKIVPADYDGDGKTDVAVFRDGNWYYLRSSDGAFRGVNFGLAGDIPVPFDYDGDSKADIAVFRQGNWYILNSSNNQFRGVSFGVSTDKPVPADYDGDGKADIAVFRDGNWYYLRSSDNAFRGVQFGTSTDKPVVGDYDGDGKADQAVFRSGTWYILRSTAGFTGVSFGNATDIPAPADYDGDGKTDVTVYRGGFWYRLNSSNGQFNAVQFGAANDRPIPSAFLPQ